VQVFLREHAPIPAGYEAGWNVRYTTDLTDPVSFYLRGEEYSAQLEHFVRRVRDGATDGTNTFSSAVETDQCIDLMIADACTGPSQVVGSGPPLTRNPARTTRRLRSTWLSRARQRASRRRARV
jgi:hypothetical protein